MWKVAGILILHLRTLKLRNIKYLFKLVKTASGFELRSWEGTHLKSKCKIKRVGGLEFLEHIK